MTTSAGTSWLTGKSHAVRTFLRMRRWLRNGNEVWRRYKRSEPLPAFVFRRGFTLHHGSGDDPVDLLHRIFADREYRQFVARVTGVLVDIGANIGAAMLDWTSLSASLEVHAYEPDPRSGAMLRHNVSANGLTNRVRVFDEGVSRSNGTMPFWSVDLSVLGTAYGAEPPHPDAQRIEVSVIGLDDVLGRLATRTVDLLKIDAEGAEVDILEGASSESLDRVRRVILEYHDNLVPDAGSRCRTVLGRHGFRMREQPLAAGLGLLYGWK